MVLFLKVWSGKSSEACDLSRDLNQAGSKPCQFLGGNFTRYKEKLVYIYISCSRKLALWFEGQGYNEWEIK